MYLFALFAIIMLMCSEKREYVCAHVCAYMGEWMSGTVGGLPTYLLNKNIVPRQCCKLTLLHPWMIAC